MFVIFMFVEMMTTPGIEAGATPVNACGIS